MSEADDQNIKDCDQAYGVTDKLEPKWGNTKDVTKENRQGATGDRAIHLLILQGSVRARCTRAAGGVPAGRLSGHYGISRGAWHLCETRDLH